MTTTDVVPGLRDRVLAVRTRLLDHLDPNALMLVLAGGVGLGTGLLAAALIELLGAVQTLAFGSVASAWRLVTVTTVGAFVVGLLVTYVVPEASGSGVLQVMRTIALRGGRFRALVPFGGAVTSSVALGTGASGGREGPVVLIGGAFGSLLGRSFGVDEDRLRTLVASGAAAGIGASFNAPIGGMLFALELIIGRFRARSLQVVVFASVVGSVTARQIIGPELTYAPRETYALNDVRELGLYALLGLVSVLIALGFVHGEDRARALFERLRVWRPIRLAIAGAAVGLVALAVPEVLGTGNQLPPIDGVRAPVQSMLDGTGFGVGWSAAAALLLLAVAKIAATALSIGSGNAVGTFAPLIFTGAAAGGAVGFAAAELLPASGVQPGAFAVVGMAAAFGGAVRAPLTAIVIVFELTGDYELVLPLMLATGLATFLADRVMPQSLYGHFLRKEGIVYAEPEDVDIMQTVTVGEVMTAEPDTVAASLPLEDLRTAFRRSGHHGFPVVEDGERLVGVVTLSDLQRVDAGLDGQSLVARARLTAGDVCTRQPVTVVPTDPVFRALRRMATLDVGRIPVVDPDDRGRLVGLLRRQDLVKAYQRAVVRSLGVQQRRESSQLRDLVGVHFLEFVVDPDAPGCGCSVRDLAWPARTVLTSIRRAGEVVVPHGDTVLQPGDEVVVLTGRDVADEVQRLLAEPDAPTAS